MKAKHENKMAKVAEETKELRLNPELYWKYREAIGQFWLAQEKQKSAAFQAQLKQCEIELAKARSHIFNSDVVRPTQQAVAIAQNHMDTVRAELEAFLGCSLKGKVINDETLLVSEAPEQI